MTYQNSVSESERELETIPQQEREPRLRRIVNLTIEIPTETIQPLITGIRRNSDLVKIV
jgi:hypothetical protein